MFCLKRALEWGFLLRIVRFLIDVHFRIARGAQVSWFPSDDLVGTSPFVLFIVFTVALSLLLMSQVDFLALSLLFLQDDVSSGRVPGKILRLPQHMLFHWRWELVDFCGIQPEHVGVSVLARGIEYYDRHFFSNKILIGSVQTSGMETDVLVLAGGVQSGDVHFCFFLDLVQSSGVQGENIHVRSTVNTVRKSLHERASHTAVWSRLCQNGQCARHRDRSLIR